MQPLPQQFGKEVVIAVPAPLVVQGDDEKVGPLEILQGLLAGGRGVEQHRITELATEAVEDGRS